MVFTVDGDKAFAAESISLAEAGLREREHLQQWVLANPAILGKDVLVVTCEFDRWSAKGGADPKDRLDVLGLDRDGRLVVAELKRDAAPDTVEMQAIKYAAMVSRFDADVLADAFAEWHRKTGGDALTSEEAAARLNAHTDVPLNSATLRTPRIVLVAGSFPSNVTATTVWLTEMGLDITLIRVQGYRTPSGVIVTVSQHYPVADVEEFTVAPTRAARKKSAAALEYPDLEWTADDFARAAAILNNGTVLAALDLCSARPGEWIPFEDVVLHSGRDKGQARGETGGFTFTLRKHFGRNNPPYEAKWAAGGGSQQYYRLGAEQARWWLAARTGEAEREHPIDRAGSDTRVGADDLC